MRFVGIEAGGTKFVCIVGNDKGRIEKRIEVPTETPKVTMGRILDFLEEQDLIKPIDAIGIGSFGPIDPDPNSAKFGYITSTPKQAWQDCNLVGMIRQKFDVPIGFDTDVNTAALGELYWGAGQGCKHLVYITVGTGIGAGLILNGRLQHGAMHLEMGHMRIPHDRNKDPFDGVCPYHGDCLEGLASGPAVKARYHVDSAMHIPPQHPLWDIESDYLALAIVNVILCYSPERIILGGGVMKQKQLLPMIQQKVIKLLNGYIQNQSITEIEKTIVLAALEQEAGNIGALALAKLAQSKV